MSPATNVVPFRDSGSFDIDCIFGVEIGRDRSGNFALGFNGLAVRTPDDRFVVPYLEEGVVGIVDASCLLFSGMDPYVFRFPVTAVEPGDMIVTADSPFSALFVVEAHGDYVRGVVPGTQQLVRYIPPSNVFGQRFFVKVFSIINLFGGGGGGGGGIFDGGGGGGINPLLLLLCCGGGTGGGGGKDSLLPLLLFSQFSGGGGGGGGGFNFGGAGGAGAASMAPLLAMLGGSGGKGDGGDLNPLLLLALSGGFNPSAGGAANNARRASGSGGGGGGRGQEQYQRGDPEPPSPQTEQKKK